MWESVLAISKRGQAQSDPYQTFTFIPDDRTTQNLGDAAASKEANELAEAQMLGIEYILPKSVDLA